MREVRPDKVHLQAAPGGFDDLTSDHLLNKTNLVTESTYIDRRHRARVAHSPLKISAFLLVILLLARGAQANNLIGSLIRVNTNGSTRPALEGVVEEGVGLVSQSPSTKRLLVAAGTFTAPSSASGDPAASYFVAVTKDQTQLTGIQLVNASTGESMASTFNNLRDVYTVLGFNGLIIRASHSDAKVRVTGTTTTGAITVFSGVENEYTPTDTSTKFRCARRKRGTDIIYFGTTDKILAFNAAGTPTFEASLGTSPAISNPFLSIDFLYNEANHLVATSFDQFIHLVASSDLAPIKKIKNYEAIPYLNLLSNTEASMFYTICGDRMRICRIDLATATDGENMDLLKVYINMSAVPTGLGNFGPFHYLIVTEPTQFFIFPKTGNAPTAALIHTFSTMARTLSTTPFFSVTSDSTPGSAFRNMFVTFSVIYNDAGLSRVDLYKQQIGLCKTWHANNSNHCLTCWENSYTDASITNTAVARPCVLKENIPAGKGVVATTTTFDTCTATTTDGRCTECLNDHSVCSSCSYSTSITAANRQYYCSYKGAAGTGAITKCLGKTEMENPGQSAWGSRLNGPDGSNVCSACSVTDCGSCFKSSTVCFQCINTYWRQISSGTHSCYAEASIPTGWGKITPADANADPSDLRDLAQCGTNVELCASNHKIASLCSSTDPANLYLDMDELDQATSSPPTADTKNTQCYATDPRPTTTKGLITGGTGTESPKPVLRLRKCAHIKAGTTLQRCLAGGCSALNTQCTTCITNYFKTAIVTTSANNCFNEAEAKTMGLYLNVDTLASCTDANCHDCWANKDDCALCNNTAPDIADKYFRFPDTNSPVKHTCLKAHQPGYRKEASSNLWEACESGLNCYRCDVNKNTCSACDPATTSTAYRWLGPFSTSDTTRKKCYLDADTPITGYGKKLDITHSPCASSGCTNCGPDNLVCIACVAGSYMYTNPIVDIPGSPITTCQVLAGLPGFGLNILSNGTPSLRTLSRCSNFCISCESDHNICTACAPGYLRYKKTPAADPTCQPPGDVPDGKGVDNSTLVLVDCRNLANGNVKQCRANYLVYETCNNGYTRDEISTTNLCVPYATYKDQKKGHNPATHLVTSCSQGTCMDCHADYRICKWCDQANNYYKDTEDTQNNCVSWNSFSETFGANQTNNLKTKCSEANCQLCKENYTICTSCDPQVMMWSRRLLNGVSNDYFLNNVANPPICRLKTQFANGWGVDPMASPKAYRSCEAANCMSCVDNFTVCDKCNAGYYRDMKTGGNRCFLPADFPAMTGINEPENIYQACSPITNCVGCRENYQICSKCGSGFYKNNLMLGNLCITKSQFLAHHGADESANLMKKCFYAGCDLCIDNFNVCTSCFNTHTFVSKAPYCTLVSETKVTGDEAGPVQYVCNSQVCAAHTPSLRDLRVKFKTKITEAMKKKFKAHYKVFMNDGRECTGCGKVPYAIEFNGDADEFIGKIGFTRRFSCNKIILTTSIDEGIPDNLPAPAPAPIPIHDRLLQILEPNAKDQFSQTIELDYNHGSNFAEVLSYIIKILNFIFMAALHICFPMSSYYINQCLSWVGHLRVLSGPLLRSNTVPIYYLSSNWIFPFFVSNPYWNRAEESACEPQMNYSENGYQCNIFANFGQNFNIMLAAFTFNFIIFTITQGYNRVTAEQHKGSSGFGLRIRKHLGLRYFYQFFDAYNLEIMGIALINISNPTEKKENIVGFILSCLVFLYYVIFYSCAFKFVWSVSTEIAENEKLGDRKIAFENWDQVKSAYDADLVFLIERYKIPQGNTWRLWIPVAWWLKNAIIQSLAVILAEEGNGQLIPILLIEFTFWLVVWVACAKKSMWDSVYDLIFGLSHVIYLIAKCASTVNDVSIDTIQGQISYCCATAILLVVCACIVHSFLIAIEYILEMFKKPAPAKAVEAKPEDKYKEEPVVVAEKVEPAPVKPQPVQVQKPVVVMGSLD